jgi:hypothetical protein
MPSWHETQILCCECNCDHHQSFVWWASCLETGRTAVVDLYYWVGTELPLICKRCCWWQWLSSQPLCPYLGSGMSLCHSLWVSVDWVTTSLYSTSRWSVLTSMAYEKMCLSFIISILWRESLVTWEAVWD